MILTMHQRFVVAAEMNRAALKRTVSLRDACAILRAGLTVDAIARIGPDLMRDYRPKKWSFLAVRRFMSHI